MSVSHESKVVSNNGVLVQAGGHCELSTRLAIQYKCVRVRERPEVHVDDSRELPVGEILALGGLEPCRKTVEANIGWMRIAELKEDLDVASNP